MSRRVILITGANGGLGQALARSFLDESPENLVCLGVRTTRDQAEKLAAEFPGRCSLVQLDVTQAEAWKNTVAKILSDHGRVDVLVNNAGRHEDGLLATLSTAAWDNVLSANLD